jgi:hypothetical protein
VLAPSVIAAVLSLSKSDPTFAGKIWYISDPKKRMAVVWAHCKTKMVCEANEANEEGEGDNDHPKRGHGGCGHVHPAYHNRLKAAPGMTLREFFERRGARAKLGT